MSKRVCLNILTEQDIPDECQIGYKFPYILGPHNSYKHYFGKLNDPVIRPGKGREIQFTYYIACEKIQILDTFKQIKLDLIYNYGEVNGGNKNKKVWNRVIGWNNGHPWARWDGIQFAKFLGLTYIKAAPDNNVQISTKQS